MDDGLGCFFFVVFLVICLLVFIAYCVYKIAFPVESALYVGKIDAWFASVPREVWGLIGVGCFLWVIFGGKPRR